MNRTGQRLPLFLSDHTCTCIHVYTYLALASCTCISEYEFDPTYQSVISLSGLINNKFQNFSMCEL